MPEDIEIPNGVIIAPDPNDYVSGDGNLAGIANRVLNPTGDYTGYTPKGEKQKNGFETNNCTAFSYTNVIETQFNYMKAQGMIPVETLNWLQANEYLDADGELNISDRALGAWAGTTQNGNSLNKVALTGYKMGLIPEKKWPSVWTNTADYYRKDMPAELYQLGLEFLKHFSMPYEQVVSEPLDVALKAAPLYVALKTCSPWTANPVKWCGIVDTNHAVELIKKDNYRIMDSYAPFVRDLQQGYVIPYFYKVLLTTIAMSTKNFKVLVISKNADGSERKDYGVLTRTPNTDIITKAEDESEWRSYSKADSYGVLTVNPDGKTNWTVDFTFDLR